MANNKEMCQFACKWYAKFTDKQAGEKPKKFCVILRRKVPDRVERVTMQYYRTVKRKMDLPGYFTWNYAETLVVDRKSKTIEYTQRIPSGGTASKKVYREKGLDILLDCIDVANPFGEIIDNPLDIGERPLETQEYILTIHFQNRPAKVIKGTYDKTALPSAWAQFASEVRWLLSTWGSGEMLDPNVYTRRTRQKGDYIYCQVEFTSGGKTYYYRTEDESIELGDTVIVPVGKDNQPTPATVVEVGFYGKDEVPFPLEKTKRIQPRWH